MYKRIFTIFKTENKESRNKQGKPRGLHISNMAVMLTDVSDGTCEELGNPVKQLKKA